MFNSRLLAAMVISVLSASLPLCAQSTLGRIEVGQPFPAERLQALQDGHPRSLSDFRGRRVLLIIFASW